MSALKSGSALCDTFAFKCCTQSDMINKFNFNHPQIKSRRTTGYQTDFCMSWQCQECRASPYQTDRDELTQQIRLSKAWLSKAWLSKAWLSKAWLSKAWLSGGWLSEGWLSGGERRLSDRSRQYNEMNPSPKNPKEECIINNKLYHDRQLTEDAVAFANY